MKWNDVKNHVEKAASSLVSPSASIPPISTSPATTGSDIQNPIHPQVRRWIIISIIFAVIIAGAVLVYLFVSKRPRGDSPLSPADAAYVDTFFQANEPAVLDEQDQDYIRTFLGNPQ